MIDQQNDEKYMSKAIEEAKLALTSGDIPVGAVIVDGEGNLISSAHNEREAHGSAAAHAEITSIERACKAKGSWRLDGCVMYVTLEPCPMCAGAIINSRISKVVCGAKNPKAGAFGSVLDLNSYPLNHKCRVTYGVLGKECSGLLSEFFALKREKSNNCDN